MPASLSAPRVPRRGERQQRRAARPCGSSIRWMAPPTSCTAFRFSPSRSPCQIRGRLEHAVVYDPMRQEIFTATRGAGAHLDNHRMRVSKQHTLEGALIATGFPYRANTKYLDSYLGMLRAVMQRPPASVARAPRRSIWPMSPRAASMPSGRSGSRPGIPPRARSSSRRPAGASARSRAPRTRSRATSSPARRRSTHALLELLAPHIPEELRAS